MITSKILNQAVGVQRDNVKDKTETAALPSTSNAVIVGRFKRGRTDRPFKVTMENYQAILGRDTTNSGYLAVEDALNRGVNELWVYRKGDSNKRLIYTSKPITNKWVHDGYVDQTDYEKLYHLDQYSSVAFAADVYVNGAYSGYLTSGDIHIQQLKEIQKYANGTDEYGYSGYDSLSSALRDFFTDSTLYPYVQNRDTAPEIPYPAFAHYVIPVEMYDFSAENPLTLETLTLDNYQEYAKERSPILDKAADYSTGKEVFSFKKGSYEIAFTEPGKTTIDAIKYLTGQFGHEPVAKVISVTRLLNRGEDIVIKGDMRVALSYDNIETLESHNGYSLNELTPFLDKDAEYDVTLD